MTNQTQTRVVANSVVDHQDVLVATLHTSCITVDRTIRLEELDVKVENLPAHCKKFLRQAILPEDFTRPYLRIIARAKAFFERYGSACEVGTVFDHARGKLLIDTMTELESDLKLQKEKDRQGYSALAKKHIDAIAADPDVVNFPHRDRLLELLEQRQPLWEDIEEKIDLSFSVMLIGASKQFDGDLYSKMQDSIVAIKKGAFGTLIKELCATARNALDKAVKAETRVHTRTVDAVWTMVEKVNELGFLDKRLRQVEKELRRFLAPLVRGEALYGLDYEDFINLMTCFANQHWLVSKLDSGEPLVETFEEDTDLPLEAGEPEPVIDAASSEVESVAEQLREPELATGVTHNEAESAPGVETAEFEEQDSSDDLDLSMTGDPSQEDIASADGAWF